MKSFEVHNIRRCGAEDASAVTGLAMQLWPGHEYGELLGEMTALLGDNEAFVAVYEADGAPVAFAQCQLRHDYVEGTETSPVGYLEGIFVAKAFRGGGAARMLLASCEEWARQKGCAEFASDCEIENTASLAFHLRSGFSEANRIICFTKKL